ncbi:MAG TPA: hypothetical protein PLV72_01385 [Candidatus Magasanikbacteria bacterium]|nr:hypothetical protein [Candidatus Magasanikbacteria bacterium]
MLDNNIAPAGGPTYTVRGPSRTWVIVGVVLALVVFAGVGSIIYSGVKNSGKTVGPDENGVVTSSQSGEINYAPTGEILSDSFGKYELNGEGFRDYSVMLDGESIQMNWYSPARQVETSKKNEMLVVAEPYYDQLLKSNSPDDSLWYEIPNTSSTVNLQVVYLYEAGEIAKPDSLAGRKVYYMLASDFGALVNKLAIYDEATKKFVKLAVDEQDIPMKLDPRSMDDTMPTYAPAFFSGYVIDNVRAAIELSPNLKISISDKDSTYLYPIGTYNKPFDYVVTNSDGSKNVYQGYPPVDNIGGIIDAKRGTNVKDELNAVALAGAKDVGDIYYFGLGYAVKRVDGSAATLEVMPSFATVDPNSKPNENLRLDIAWNDKIATATDTFDFLGPFRVACGMVMYSGQSIVDEVPGFDPKNLQVVGHASNGDEIYELKNAKNNPYLNKLADAFQFTSQLIAWGETALSEKFNSGELSNDDLGEYFNKYHQVFFWKDPIGHYHAFKKHSLQTLAECGKPVIYLYPEKTLTANVQVTPNGGFSKTNPDYGIGGWNVVAEPNGALTNLENGLNYPYLFWEGKAYSYDAPTKGFVLKRENVDRDMNKILAKYGLNEKESADFMEFWGEKLKVKPYVFVGFLTNKEFDPIAPLAVSPAPQTVIRIFMDYTPLDSDMYVSAPQITTPVRSGFTVVEWGGRPR